MGCTALRAAPPARRGRGPLDRPAGTKILRLLAAAALLGAPLLAPAAAEARQQAPIEIDPGQVVERTYTAILANNPASTAEDVYPLQCAAASNACDIIKLAPKTSKVGEDDDYYVTIILDWFQSETVNNLDLYVWDDDNVQPACTSCATNDPAATADGDEPSGKSTSASKPEVVRLFRSKGTQSIVVNNSRGPNTSINPAQSGYKITVKFELITPPTVFESLDPEPVFGDEGDFGDDEEDFGFGDEGGEEAFEFPFDPTVTDVTELADEPGFAPGAIAFSPEFDIGFGNAIGFRSTEQTGLDFSELNSEVVIPPRLTKPSGLSLALALGLVPVAFVIGAGGLLYKRRPAALSI